MARPAIEKVLVEIDAMLVTLKKQKTQEVRLRDTCVTEIRGTNTTLENLYRKQNHLNTTYHNEMNVKETSENKIAAINTEIDEINVDMEKEAANREQERAEFSAKVKEHQEAQ